MKSAKRQRNVLRILMVPFNVRTYRKISGQNPLALRSKKIICRDILFEVWCSTKTLRDLHYRIIKTNREEVRAQRKKWERDYTVDREQKFIEYFSAKTPAKTGKFVLPDDGDYQSIALKSNWMPYRKENT